MQIFLNAYILEQVALISVDFNKQDIWEEKLIRNLWENYRNKHWDMLQL